MQNTTTRKIEIKRACQQVKHELLASRAFFREVSGTLDDIESPEDMTPSDINEGWCSEFAERVVAELGWPPDVEAAGCPDFGYDPIHPKWGQHVWVWCRSSNTHHDAEMIGGATDWKDLPIFQRK